MVNLEKMSALTFKSQREKQATLQSFVQERL